MGPTRLWSRCSFVVDMYSLAVQRRVVKRSRPREGSCSRFCWTVLALASNNAGLPPRPPAAQRGERYPAGPPTVEEIVAVMRAVGDRAHGHRLRARIVLLWRAGLRISEALALRESDFDAHRGTVLVRRGKGGKRREVGMGRWTEATGSACVTCSGRALCATGSSVRSARWFPPWPNAVDRLLRCMGRPRGRTRLRAWRRMPWVA